jgi:septal ring factor EnvC (AmiA/AmiB activator)
LASGLSNGAAEPIFSSKVDSPLHREPLQDAQRDLVRQLQEANAELTKQLHQAQTTASNREAQVQHELDSTRQKLKVMKEQLMTGQADAEETGRQILEQATQEMLAKHALELQRVNAKVGISDSHQLTRLCEQLHLHARYCTSAVRIISPQLPSLITTCWNAWQQERIFAWENTLLLHAHRCVLQMEEQNSTISMLEQKLAQKQAEGKVASHNLASIETLQQRLSQKEASEAAARADCHRLQTDCAAKAQQIANLEVAIGELTYAAERGQKLELSTCQAQARFWWLRSTWFTPLKDHRCQEYIQASF